MTITGWRHRLILIAPFVAITGLIVLSPSDDGPTVCPFALCTGMACPGCGLSRAASSLIRGDFGTAFTYHPLIPIIALQLMGAWVYYLLRRRGTVKPLSTRWLSVGLLATAIGLFGVWVLRILTGSLPPV